MPHWAVGSWHAVTAINEDVIVQLGKAGVPATRLSLARTTMTITAHAIHGCLNCEITLADAQHVEAAIVQTTVRSVVSRPAHPILIGKDLPYDFSAVVPVAILDIEGCAESQSGALDAAGQPGVPPHHPQCALTYKIMQFPDPSRIGVVESGAGEIVIYERQP